MAGQGLRPFYGPIEEQELAAQAMAGFANNPLEAIQQLARVNPAAAQKYYNDYTDSQAKMAAASREEAVSNSTIGKNNLANYERIRGIVGSMMNTATKDTFDPLRKQAVALAEKNGVTLDDLPSTYDAEGLKSWVRSTVPVDKLMDNDRAAAAEDRAERTLQSNVALRGGALKVQGLSADERARHNRVTEATGKQNADTKSYTAHNPKKGSGGIARPAAGGTPTKKFIIEGGKIKTRQPDGSYK